MDPEFTLVTGVDDRHLDQLRLVFRTWKRHKPSLLSMPMVVFYDRESTSEKAVLSAVSHPNLCVHEWPPFGKDVVFDGDQNTKWYHPQRYKMLAGFVHVPAYAVGTPYWLKIDTDVVAEGQDDWIDNKWFANRPAIVAQPWGYTKPPEQMLLLDKWVEDNRRRVPLLSNRRPLQLKPEPGSNKVKHSRMISWCGFFYTGFTKYCSQIANETCGEFQLPVPSQDGYMWYVAKRAGLEIKTVNMKQRGWQWWSKMENIQNAVWEVMRGQ